jgi:glyoxylase-like metal-dependent hydrolase (beta-lactamase superfamily II)
MFAILLFSSTTVHAAQNFDVVKLADGVYATIRREPPGSAVDANNVFIINRDDVIVVDSNISPASTREVLAALRKLTSKPVRYVINTHWHDDHILGNEVYQQAFPGVEFIGHAALRDYLPTTGLENRQKTLASVPEFIDMLRTSLSKNESFVGGPLSDEERASHVSELRIAERFVTDVPKTKIILPTLTVTDRLTLHREGRSIEIRNVGRGHTSGDLVVFLPQEKILISGDLVVSPVPLVGAEQSHGGEWGKTMHALLDLGPAVIVPGHGAVQRDDSYLRLLAKMFDFIQEQVAAGIARGESVEALRKSIDLEEFRKAMAGDSVVRNMLFRGYVSYPSITSAFNDAKSAQASK